MAEPHSLHFTSLEQMVLSGTAGRRLLVACLLGGAVGIEREWRHKDSGLRTNMLLCMGAALFTIMSVVLAGDSTPNKGQVAANIVQGVGFIGAGLILHNRNRVMGLTSAATVFVVAAIGMTCGAGLYLEAVIATALVLFALQAVGLLEVRLGWKRYPMVYEVRCDVGAVLPSSVVGPERSEALAEETAAAQHRMQRSILKVLDQIGQRLSIIERDNVAGMERVSFEVSATRRQHDRVLQQLRDSDVTDQVVAFQAQEDE